MKYALIIIAMLTLAISNHSEAQVTPEICKSLFTDFKGNIKVEDNSFKGHDCEFSYESTFLHIKEDYGSSIIIPYSSILYIYVKRPYNAPSYSDELVIKLR